MSDAELLRAQHAREAARWDSDRQAGAAQVARLIEMNTELRRDLTDARATQEGLHRERNIAAYGDWQALTTERDDLLWAFEQLADGFGVALARIDCDELTHRLIRERDEAERDRDDALARRDELGVKVDLLKAAALAPRDGGTLRRALGAVGIMEGDEALAEVEHIRGSAAWEITMAHVNEAGRLKSLLTDAEGEVIRHSAAHAREVLAHAVTQEALETMRRRVVELSSTHPQLDGRSASDLRWQLDESERIRREQATRIATLAADSDRHRLQGRDDVTRLRHQLRESREQVRMIEMRIRAKDADLARFRVHIDSLHAANLAVGREREAAKQELRRLEIRERARTFGAPFDSPRPRPTVDELHERDMGTMARELTLARERQNAAVRAANHARREVARLRRQVASGVREIDPDTAQAMATLKAITQDRRVQTETPRCRCVLLPWNPEPDTEEPARASLRLTMLLYLLVRDHVAGGRLQAAVRDCRTMAPSVVMTSPELTAYVSRLAGEVWDGR